jgi:hypothetical protein
MTAPAPVWRDRLAESIQHAFDACWSARPPKERPQERGDLPLTDDEQLERELQFLALADLILPFAAAGLLDESMPVGDLPAPADIRRDVRQNALDERYMSVGCQIARTEGGFAPLLREELEREWSTWLTFCMHAHSPELRATLPTLYEALDAIGALLIAPKRRIERLGPDGERLASLVPRRTEDSIEAARLDSLLDQCEIVAAHADSFRILGPLFPQLIATVWIDHPYQSSEHNVGFPFAAYLWPFDSTSFRAVGEICEGIQSLAASLNVDEEDEDRELRARSYIR